MAQATATLTEIDEALLHASLVPENERGTAWHAYTDRLLEERKRLEKNTPPGGTSTEPTFSHATAATWNPVSETRPHNPSHETR